VACPLKTMRSLGRFGSESRASDIKRGEASEEARGHALLEICRHKFSGHSVRQGALTSVVCGFTAGGSGKASTDAINSSAVSAKTVHQTSFVATCDYANRFDRGQPIAVCHWREVHVSSLILIAIALAGGRIARLRLMLTERKLWTAVKRALTGPESRSYARVRLCRRRHPDPFGPCFSVGSRYSNAHLPAGLAGEIGI